MATAYKAELKHQVEQFETRKTEFTENMLEKYAELKTASRIDRVSAQRAYDNAIDQLTAIENILKAVKALLANAA